MTVPRKKILRQMRMYAAENGIELPPDAVEAMEEALGFFLQQARRVADKLPKTAKAPVSEELIDRAVAMYERVATAAQGLASYKHPRLTAMKVGQDRESPFLVPDGVTAAQLKAELMEMMIETGLAPDLKLLEGVANREEEPS